MIKDIPGFEGLYCISTEGVVYSFYNIGNSRVKLGKKKREMKQTINFGYASVGLFKNGVQKFYRVHRLVALTFIPNLDNKPQINHIDFNKLNNNVSNLEWCTSSKDIKHSYDHNRIKNTFKKGVKHPNSKLSEEQVLEIRRLGSLKIYSHEEISKQFHIARREVSRIINRDRWKHI